MTKRILRRRPSPALLIAAMALFVALGGTAYALTITGANVRNGSLTGDDIRNRSITQADLRGRSLKGTLMLKDSVGYNAVKEEGLDASKLKKVKSAESADAIAGVTVRRFDAATVDLGASTALATVGPFTVTARCRVQGTDHVAEIVLPDEPERLGARRSRDGRVVRHRRDGCAGARAGGRGHARVQPGGVRRGDRP